MTTATPGPSIWFASGWRCCDRRAGWRAAQRTGYRPGGTAGRLGGDADSSADLGSGAAGPRADLLAAVLDGFVTGPSPRPAEPLGNGGEQLYDWMAGLGDMRASKRHPSRANETDAQVGVPTKLPDRQPRRWPRPTRRARLRPRRRAVLPGRLGRLPRPADRPLRAADRDRAIPTPGRAGHDRRALRARPAGVLDRRQRFLPSRPGRGRPPARRVAESRARAPAFYASWLNQIEIVFSVIQRKVLTPNDFCQPAGRRSPRRLRAPLQPDRQAVRVDVHPPRPRRPHRARLPSRAATQARRLIAIGLTAATA